MEMEKYKKPFLISDKRQDITPLAFGRGGMGRCSYLMVTPKAETQKIITVLPKAIRK